MQDYDDEPVQRPKWLGWVIIIGMVLVVLGLLNVGVRLMLGTSSDQAAATTAQAVVQHNPALAAGKALVQNSDCMRCHGIDRTFVGPGFVEVAERYQDHADGAAYLAHKIREGSVGVWGRVIMPRHPHVTQEQSVQMAQWILALAPNHPDPQSSSAP